MKRLLVVGLSWMLVACGTTPSMQTLGRNPQVHAAALSPRDLLARLFERLDANHDGRLTPSELDLPAAAFIALDTDGDGRISLAEWTRAGSARDTERLRAAVIPMADSLYDHVTSAGRMSVDRWRAVMGPSAEALLHGTQPHADGTLDRTQFEQLCASDGGSSSTLGGYIDLAARITEQQAIHPARVALTDTPAELGIAFEDVSFRSPDGLTLRGWYIPSARATDKTIILLDGYKSCRSGFVRDGQIRMLHGDYNLLTFDMRNCGDSDGTATTYGYMEAGDVLAAVDYLKTRGLTKFGIYGVSLGGATAIRAAALSQDLLAVVDDCAFATVVSAFTGFVSYTGAPCPQTIAQAAIVLANQELGFDLTSTEPITQDAAIAPRPFFVIHGAADPVISVDNARINYTLAGNGLYKQLWIVPNARHGQSAVVAPGDYQSKLLAFYHRVL